MAEKAMYYVYILDCSDGSLYTGSTDDIPRRLAVHNTGKGAKYTRQRLPVTLAYHECFTSKSDALKREATIKKLKRNQKLALCQSQLGKGMNNFDP